MRETPPCKLKYSLLTTTVVCEEFLQSATSLSCLVFHDFCTQLLVFTQEEYSSLTQKYSHSIFCIHSSRHSCWTENMHLQKSVGEKCPVKASTYSCLRYSCISDIIREWKTFLNSYVRSVNRILFPAILNHFCWFVHQGRFALCKRHLRMLNGFKNIHGSLNNFNGSWNICIGIWPQK